MKKKIGKSSCVNRLLAFMLAAVLALALCACGKTETGKNNSNGNSNGIANSNGGKETTQSGNNGGNDATQDNNGGKDDGATQDNNGGNDATGSSGGQDNNGNGNAAGNGSGVENGTETDDFDGSDGRVFWVEAEPGPEDHTRPDYITIYLRDEAVNQLEYDENAQVVQGRNYIQVRFLRGDVEELSCLLNIEFWNFQRLGGESCGQPNEPEKVYPNNTFSWSLREYGLLDELKDCDYVSVIYYDNANPGAERTIFELRNSMEVAALFEKETETPVLQANEGVRFGFDGNFMSVRISGDEHLRLGEGYAQRLYLNKEGGMYEDGIHITFSFRGDGTFFNEDISGFQYESDGWVKDAGWTAKQAPLFLWHEDDGESFTAWYYAPGFREVLESMDTYWLGYDTDTNQRNTMLCEGNIGQILGEYVTYNTPIKALPAEFIGEAKAGDEKYFTPLTPYYTVMRYDYPAVPRTTDWGWKLVDSTHMTYYFMSMELELTSMTEIVLSSYNSLGEPVQNRVKEIYEDEESAIHANVHEHEALMTVTGTTYGTEEDFARWIYDRFTGKTADDDRAKILLSHEGNVVYSSRGLYYRADEDLNFANGEPNVMETGSFAYSYSYGFAGNETGGENTCTYKGYRTFNREQVKDAAQKPR